MEGLVEGDQAAWLQGSWSKGFTPADVVVLRDETYHSGLLDGWGWTV